MCWVTVDDLERRGLDARLVGADRLYAVAAGDDTSEVAAESTLLLLDEDATSWSSWNAYAEELARETSARVVRISDGGITGPAFFDHVRRIKRPVVNSPKGQTDPAAAGPRPAPRHHAPDLLDLVPGMASRRSPRFGPGRRRRPR